jgi:hypothetical protein
VTTRQRTPGIGLVPAAPDVPGANPKYGTGRTGTAPDRCAYGYATLPCLACHGAETRLRWTLLERAQRDGLQLRTVYVDETDQPPYAFATLRELLRRRNDIRAVVLPDLTHTQHIPALSGLSQRALERHLGVRVLLAAPPPQAPRPSTPAASVLPLRPARR